VPVADPQVVELVSAGILVALLLLLTALKIRLFLVKIMRKIIVPKGKQSMIIFGNNLS